MALTERRGGLVCGFLLVAASAVSAQSTGAQAWTMETVNARALGKRTIYVVTPDGYRGGKAGYPVVVMLDADDEPQFRLWIGQAAYLTNNSPGLPPVIIVGIANGNDRVHDMTPPAAGSSVKEYSNAGGADAFAAFILGEVLPHVRAKYRTLGATILAGHSAGGLFALDVAAKKPEAFQGIIAMSPALWFNDAALVDTYADLIAKAGTRPRVFVTSGGEEPNIDVPSKQFARKLAAIDSGRFGYRGYPDATHTLSSMSFADGLRFVFEPLASRHFAIESFDPAAADAEAVSNVLRSSEQAYAEAARSLHLPEQLPELLVNRLGYRLLNNGKAALAVQVFERNVRNYSESVNVYDSLADALIAAGDKAGALKQLRTAVTVARNTGVKVPSATQRKLDELESKK
jgi:predicted alpha/beta superfamily hydrolase